MEGVLSIKGWFHNVYVVTRAVVDSFSDQRVWDIDIGILSKSANNILCCGCVDSARLFGWLDGISLKELQNE